MNRREDYRFRNRRGNKQQIKQEYQILARPQGQQEQSDAEDSSTYMMVPANTLDSLDISLNGQKASFKDGSGSGFEITVQSIKRPEGCFLTLKRLNVPKHLEQYDSLWAFLHRNTVVDDWKDAAKELSTQFHKYHSDRAHMPVSEKSLSFLEQHHIKKLLSPNELFPDAIYYCHLCHYHISSVKNARNHFEGSDHLKDEERIQRRNDFISGCNNLPSAFYEALNQKIGSTVLELMEEAYQDGKTALQTVEDVLRSIFQSTLGACQFTLDPFGPILRQCSDNDSPLEFCFDSEDISLSDALDTLKQLTEEVLRYQNEIHNVADACLKSSSTQIISGSLEGRRFAVYYKGHTQLKLSQLLVLYTENRPFVINLMRLVRHWAKMCGLDRSDNTRPGLHNHAFDIMIIHFLQKKGLLPIVSLSQEENEIYFRPESVNIQEIQQGIQEGPCPEVPDIGKLFLEFLSYYSLNHEEAVQITRSTAVSKDETKWHRKLFHIVDPFRTENVVTFSRAFQCYFFNCFISTYAYLIVPRDKAGPISQVSLYQKLTESPRKKKSKIANADVVRKDFGCEDNDKSAVEALQMNDSTECQNTPLKCSSARKMIEGHSIVPDVAHLDGNMMRTSRRTRHKKSTSKADMTPNKMEFIVETDAEHELRMKVLKVRVLEYVKRKDEEDAEMNEALKRKSRMMYSTAFLKLHRNSYILFELCQKEKYDDRKNEQYWTGKGFEYLSSLEYEQSTPLIGGEVPEYQDSPDSNATKAAGSTDCNSSFVEVHLPENKSEICSKDLLTEEHAEPLSFCEAPHSSDEMPATRAKPSTNSCLLPNISSSENWEIIPPTSSMDVIPSEDHERDLPYGDSTLASDSSLKDCIEWNNETSLITDEGPTQVSIEANNPCTSSLLKDETVESDIDDIDILAQLAPSSHIIDVSAEGNPVETSPNVLEEYMEDFVLPSLPPDVCEGIESLTVCEEKQMDTDSPTISVENMVDANNICFEELHIKHELQGTLSDLVDRVCCDWTVDDFCFDFETKENFTGGFIPEYKCSHCDKMDHPPDSCPSIQLLPLVPYETEPPTNQTNDLCKLIELNYVQKKVSIQHLEIADDFVRRLLKTLEKEKQFGKGVRLDIFGSLRNGFGIDSSDVDLCLRFKDEEQPADIGNKIMYLLPRSLRSIGCPSDEIRVITNCKVPIVKFVWWPRDHPELKIDGDISFYNNLAIANTKLLHEYSIWGDFIDEKDKRRPRVKLLGLWIKMWAKKCGIGDASSGSLSSYAYTLLMIHFLQNLEQPVLPRLQDKNFYNSKGESRAETTENQKYDTYFYEGSPKQHKKFSKNKMNVAELFIGFLDYYSQFDFTNTVIQIRQKNVLTKLEKGWSGKIISIEDPFELEHNLGRGVSVRMAIYIQNTIRRSRDVLRSRDVYHNFFKDNNLDVGAEATMNKALSPLLQEALLDACIGTEAAPPDRICTICKQPGHRHHGCPNINKRRPPQFNATGSEPRRRHNFVSSNGNQRQFGRPPGGDEMAEGTGKISLQPHTPFKESVPEEAKQIKSATDANSRWMNGKVTPGFGGKVFNKKKSEPKGDSDSVW